MRIDKKNTSREFQGTSFIWGAATSAFQIEGASDLDGRGPSIWDTFCKVPGVIADGSDGQHACQHYERLEHDLDLMSGLSLQGYRFSTSWSRIIPHGFGAVNPKGLDFYDRLIDGLLARGIKPFLTLNHWDLPQGLQDLGGWLNRDTCHHFSDYAGLVAKHFGDRLASITTHNEPWVIATLGHEQGIFAPGMKSRKSAMQVSHHLLLSHGIATAAIRAIQPALDVGIVLNLAPTYLHGTDEATPRAAREADGWLVRWYMDPLLNGSYPEDMVELLGADAPTVAATDLATISVPIDFLGMNYYTVNRVGLPDGADTAAHVQRTDMGWEVCPAGLTDLLLRLNRDYHLPPLYISENGAAFPDQLLEGRVCDTDRVNYVSTHIAAMQAAMKQGVDIRGYFLWSLFDNFEWAHGYSKRFGMVYVNYHTYDRTLKDSALWYRDHIVSERSLVRAGAFTQSMEAS